MVPALTNIAPVKLNPETRDQGLRLATVAIAGPALIWTGLKYPGSAKAKAVVAGIGVLLIATNYSIFTKKRQA